MPELVQGASGPGRLSLDQLIALNDEIAALARSGLPLERGLIEVGGDVRGRLGQIASSLGRRMSQGESLSDALRSEGDDIPPLYRAVVDAGLRAGRLPAALEGLATYARSYAESRRVLGLALWYPLLVLSLAFILFLFLVTRVVPGFLAAFQSLRLPVHTSLAVLARLGETAHYWWPTFPVVLVLIWAWWVMSGRSASLRPGRTGSPMRWFPWMRSMLANFEAANFADLLALLLEHRVPFPEALVLSAEASGDPAVIRAGRALAAEVEHGASPGDAVQGRVPFPPLLRWLLATGTRQGDLVGALRQMAGVYRRRAFHQAEKAKILLPTVMLFAIGATATLVYGLTLFLPFTTLLRELATG
jgi:general secretion pathway protein F